MDGAWQVELEPEVEAWFESLSVRHQAVTIRYLELLEERGDQLRMPPQPKLGSGPI